MRFAGIHLFPRVLRIASSAFNSCNSLTFASFPDSFYIDRDAFAGCHALTTLTLGCRPPEVRYENAFARCPALRYLALVDALGEPLADDALEQARSAYKRANDGDDTDEKWYGREIGNSPIYKITLDPPERKDRVFVQGYAMEGQTVSVTYQPRVGEMFVDVTFTPDGGTQEPLLGGEFTMPASNVVIAIPVKANRLLVKVNAEGPVEGFHSRMRLRILRPRRYSS